MEFQPQTQPGKRLFSVLTNWMEKSPKLGLDDLKRTFFLCSLKLKNRDEFITILYGLKVLDRSPSYLSLKFPSTLLRVQHAIEISLNKRRAKELVVALELSKNQRLLMEILGWTEKLQFSSTPLGTCNEVVDLAEPVPPEFSAAMPAECEDRKHRFSPILRSSSRELPQEGPVLILASSDGYAASAPSVVTHAEPFVAVEAPQAVKDKLPLPSRYNCDVDGCDLQCRSQRLLSDHQRYKHDGICPHCLRALRIHTLKWSHDCLNSKRPRVTDPSLVCSHCSEKFESPKALWNHLDNISVPCKKCGKKARKRDKHKC